MRTSAQAEKQQRPAAPSVSLWQTRPFAAPNRPGAVAQGKRQEMTGNSPQALPLKGRIPSVLPPEPLEPQQGSLFGSINNSPRLVVPSGGAVKPIQRMAASAYQYQQAGGTCGLYSLGMAISGVDTSKEQDALIKLILLVGNEVGTFVGEFMDASNLAAVARRLGVTVSVTTFTDANDMKTKLTNTGADGVVMAYSVFGFPGYSNDLALATFKHLFSHWSVVEGLAANTLTVRDPNDPANTSDFNAATFWQANQDASNVAGQFSFAEYQQRRNRRVSDLRESWEEGNLKAQAGGAGAKTALNPRALPSVALDLAGKMISVRGAVDGDLCAVKEAATLREDDDTHSEKKKLANGDVVKIVDRNKDKKTFSLGAWYSPNREHYWVRTADGTVGWVRKSALDL